MHCEIEQLLWKTEWKFLKKTELPYNPAIPIWVYTKRIESRVSKRYLCAQMSIDRQMDKHNVYTYNGILFSKKKKCLDSCSNIDKT
jgi:hypothetical protein